jgi:GH35 family endo-1,4-beta-xylanase
MPTDARRRRCYGSAPCDDVEKTFTYAQADPLMAFAKASGLAVHGHTLVWHNQTPSWVFTGADGLHRAVTRVSRRSPLVACGMR